MSDAEYDEDSSSTNQGFYDNERESDEDTEDASETDMIKNEPDCVEIKEEIYQEKLSLLKDQLKQLNEGTHPEYLKKLKNLEFQYEERIFSNDAYLAVETERIEQEYINEKKAAIRDFEDRKICLKESLLADLEEKRKNVENERISLEFNSDSYEPKPATTRKLRRRPNDPTPAPEKRKRGKCHGFRQVGSAALSICCVAEGSCEAYFEQGIHCWDMAGGAIILTEAGGYVCDTSGEPFDLMSRRILVASTPELAKKIFPNLKTLSEIERD
ncbi:hypothetical protein RND71_043995 [Anisodus tanguticus]|uniref:inositol-phosphate phosphatase n=1 Tax=Anisodus tanguticus TaxID=243964 RepID=A0AAE1UN12_9SOLA|nr:hypothetical protein RND71_043995 [Anisodus tanguticus]